MADVSNTRPLGLTKAIVFREVIIVGSDQISDVAAAPTLSVGSGTPDAVLTRPQGSLFLDKAGASEDAILYINTDGASAWSAVQAGGAGSDAIADTNTYYTTDTINGAFDALALQIGGLTDATFSFAEQNVLANDDAIYAALEKLDLEWGDLGSVANTEGASRVAIENAAAYYTGAEVESALANLGAQIGGDNDSTFAFTQEVVVADNDSVYTALDALDQEFVAYRTNFVELEDFHGQPATEAEGPFILNAGIDGTAIDPAIDTSQPAGVWDCKTGTNDGTVAQDGSQLVWSKMPIRLSNLGGGIAIEARIRIKTAITNAKVFFGLTDNTALEEPFTNTADVITAVADDAVGFLYSTDATTDDWWAVAVDSTVKDAANASSGIAPTADVFQILGMRISADGADITFTINGIPAGTMTADVGVGDDVVLYPTLCCNGDGTASKNVDIDFIRISGQR